MKALIITPYLLTEIHSLVDISEYDLILCADSAYLSASKEHIKPHIIIGDFDHGTSIIPPHDDNIIAVPCEKDDTDTMLCLKYAIDHHADSVTILGGIGGRLDHTFANLQALAYGERHHVSVRIIHNRDEAFLVTDKISLPKRTDAWYLSVFAYDSICEGVTIKGTKYEVENISLNTNFPLGVSNEIISEYAEIAVKKGRLLVILSRKE